MAAAGGYGKKQVAIWFNSLLATGYTGRIFVIVYDADFEVVDYMREKGALVHCFAKDEKRRRYTYSHLKDQRADRQFDGESWTNRRWVWNLLNPRLRDWVHDRRFFHAWQFLDRHCRESGEAFRFLAFSDLRDVVFQSEPFAWLASNLKADEALAVSREPVTHQHPWTRRKMLREFGASVYTAVQDEPVVCCGFFGGRFNAAKDALLTTYLFDQSKRMGDQQALNVLLNLEPWRSATRFTDWTVPWTLHASVSREMRQGNVPIGSWADPANLPVFDGGLIKTPGGEPFAVVHQYDRLPGASDYFESLYGYAAS